MYVSHYWSVTYVQPVHAKECLPNASTTDFFNSSA